MRSNIVSYLWYKVRFPPYALTLFPIIFSGRDQNRNSLNDDDNEKIMSQVKVVTSSRAQHCQCREDIDASAPCVGHINGEANVSNWMMLMLLRLGLSLRANQLFYCFHYGSAIINCCMYFHLSP